ncbi:MAG TPA: lipid II flippase MurJ [Vicinamibacterales bacterium]|nr:lipid II flippase MurJ [Vicinamibacterales bacterium]
MTPGRGTHVVAGRLALARALSRVPAALLPLVVAAIFGASRETDTFFLVYAGVLFASGAFGFLETAVVPFVPGTMPSAARERFAGVVLGRLLLVLLPLAVALAAGALVWRMEAAAPAATGNEGWRHLVVLAGLPVLSGAGALLTGYLNAGERYLASALAAALKGLTALALGVVFSSALGLVAFSVGILCGEVVGFAWLFATSRLPIASLYRPGARGDLRPFWMLAGSMFGAAVANSSRGFVDRLIASTLGPGAVSILEYAERVFHMTVALVGAPIATVHLSRWASAFHGGSPVSVTGLGTAVRRARPLPLGVGLAMLVAMTMAVFSPPAAGWLDRTLGADRGLFQLALVMYLAGAVPYLLGLVASQAILVLRDARFVLAATVALALANVPLDLAGVFVLGLPGIALASSILSAASWLASEGRLRWHVRQSGHLGHNGGESPRQMPR